MACPQMIISVARSLVTARSPSLDKALFVDLSSCGDGCGLCGDDCDKSVDGCGLCCDGHVRSSDGH